MSISAIEATRDYLNEAASRGVMAVSPAAVARRLDVTEDQAIALLNCLAETEGRIAVHGYLDCPECHEQIDLKGTKLADLIREAERYAGKNCPFCDALLPDSPDVKVGLRFFFEAAAPMSTGAAADRSQAATSSGGSTSIRDLATLKEITGIQCQNIVIAGSGSTVLVGDTVTQAGAGGVVTGILSGQGASVRDMAAGGRDVHFAGGPSSPPASTPAALPILATPTTEPAASEPKPAPWYLSWPTISLAIGLLGALCCWLFLPDFRYRTPLILLAAGLLTWLAFSLNPALWARRLFGAVLTMWIGVTGLGVAGKIAADVPALGRFEAVIDSPPPAATFHPSMAAVLIFLGVYDYKQRHP